MAVGELAKPLGRFYAIQDFDNYAVKGIQRSEQGVAWDPWPVNNFSADATFKAAKWWIDQRNLQCVNICHDKIVLLPASGNTVGLQGGCKEMSLCE